MPNLRFPFRTAGLDLDRARVQGVSLRITDRYVETGLGEIAVIGRFAAERTSKAHLLARPTLVETMFDSNLEPLRASESVRTSPDGGEYRT